MPTAGRSARALRFLSIIAVVAAAVFAILDPGIWFNPDWLTKTPQPIGPIPDTRTPVIFIPGIGGSLLAASRSDTMTFLTKDRANETVTYAAGDVVWLDWGGLIHHGITDQEYFGLLRFDEDSEPVSRDLSVLPNGLVTLPGAYGDIVPFFTANGYVLDRDLFIFTYDWRRSADFHVARLDELVTRALGASATGKVDLVAHSQGTLVARSYLTSARAVERKNVRKVLLMAGPFLGTPDGTEAAIPGRCVSRPTIPRTDVPIGVCVLRERTEQYIVRGMPGSLELSVSQGYFRGLISNDDTDAYVDDRPFVRSISHGYDRVRDAMLAPDVGVSRRALRIAEDWHADDRAWLDAIPDTASVSILVGTGRCTASQVRRFLDLSWVGAWFQDAPLIGRRDGYEISRHSDGDQTVVARSAGAGDATNIYYRNYSHGEFASADKGLVLALRLLRDEQAAREGPRKPVPNLDHWRNCD